MVNEIFNEDCIAGMAHRIPAQSIDLIVTDPPFAIDFKAQRANYNRTGNRVLEGYNEVSSSDYFDFTKAWMTQARRCLKPDGSMYVFSGWNNLKDILVALDACDFITVNHIVWKYQFGVVTKRKYVTSHYHCIYVCLDDRVRRFYQFSRVGRDAKTDKGGSENYRDREDVWTINREYWTGDIKTPTKLPAELVSKILSYSSMPGDVVMDPFLGSGQVAVVSKLNGRAYTGFEIVPDYFRFALTRLNENRYRIQCEKPEPKAVSLFD